MRRNGNDSTAPGARVEAQSRDRQDRSGARDQGYRNGSQDRGNDSYDRGRGNSSDRGRNDSYDRGRGNSYQRQYRDNDRVQSHGRISRYSHERGGYRVWLDNGPYSYWIPEARWRNNWRIGIDIVLGGIFRAGTVYADVYDDPYYGGGYYDRGDYGYGNDYVTGWVDRVDYRSGVLWLRDDRSGRTLTVDTRAIDPRYSRIDARDLQRGDRVSFIGRWLRNGLFSADRIDSVDTRPY